MSTIERSIKTYQLGLRAAVIAAITLLFLAIDPISRDFMGLTFLLFAILSDTYCVIFFLWLIRRLKNRSKAISLTKI